MRGLAGFTLIELLIAMLLASLLAVLTYTGLQLGLQGWAVSERRLSELEDRYLGQTLLRRLLESPLQRLLRDEEGTLQMGFYGTEQDLVFVASLPQIEHSADLYWVQLAQVELEDQEPPTWQLVLRYLPFDRYLSVDWPLLQEQLADSGREEVLRDGLAGPLRFAYYGELPGAAAAWHMQWQAQEHLPSLVKVDVSEESDDAIRLSVAPREMAYGVKQLE